MFSTFQISIRNLKIRGYNCTILRTKIENGIFIWIKHILYIQNELFKLQTKNFACKHSKFTTLILVFK